MDQTDTTTEALDQRAAEIAQAIGADSVLILCTGPEPGGETACWTGHHGNRWATDSAMRERLLRRETRIRHATRLATEEEFGDLLEDEEDETTPDP